MEYPVRNYWQASRYSSRLLTSKNNYVCVDGSDCWGHPSTGIHIRNQYGEELITWDSFVHLWLQNCECDEPFVTKPFLMRKG